MTSLGAWPLGRRPARRILFRAAAAGGVGLLAACGGGPQTAPPSATAAALAVRVPDASTTSTVRIGYIANVTHAPGLVADAEGLFTRRIGAGKVTTRAFNAGPEVIQALFSNSLDIAYLGSNPTITAYAQSRGTAIRVIAGAACGGAALVVRPSITSPEQLRGTTLATPQLGSTQDVALRYWLSTKGFTTTTEGGGQVGIQPQKNSAALQAYASGQIAGAWVPEPYATLFVGQGAHVLIDERSLWPGGAFVTTDIAVRTEFLTRHPETVRAFLEADLDALDLIDSDPMRAQRDVISRISRITGQQLTADLIAASWKNLTFTADPLATALKVSADHSDAVGLLPSKPADGFAGLWDLDLLNAALKARGKPKVTS